MSEGRVKLDSEDDGNYFTSQNKNIKFVKTGCSLLDYVLGGGWAIGRFANIVGDSSTGKTLLAIEACANFARQYPKGKIYYRETELAFDYEYAHAIGMPIERVDFADNESYTTIEDYYNDLLQCVEEIKDRGVEGIYIVDSLDALSDKAEMNRKFEEDSYNTSRAKQMHKLFRMVNAKVAEANMCHLVISQEKDKLNAMMFGKKSTRSGGRALDFFASQILWLAHLGKVYKTREGIKRSIGINVKAKCEKNKIGLPFKECELEIKFGSGIDSLSADLNFLKEYNMLNRITSKKITEYKASIEDMSDEEYWQETARVGAISVECAREIDSLFMKGVRQKYR